MCLVKEIHGKIAIKLKKDKRKKALNQKRHSSKNCNLQFYERHYIGQKVRENLW